MKGNQIAVKKKNSFMLSFSLSMYGLFVGGTKYLDRTGSMRADDFNQPQMVRNRAKKVSLFQCYNIGLYFFL